MNTSKLVILFLFFLLTMAQCEEQVLLKATNDQDSKVETLALRLNGQGKPTHLLVQRAGKPDKAYTPADLKKGVVLKQKSGNDLLIMRTLAYDPEVGADIELSYLYNGIPPVEYRKIKLEMRHEEGKWVVRDSDSDVIESVHILANVATVFGYQKAIGIRELELRPRKQ